MIIDYIGQELIWNLTATHPYKQNRRNYSIRINCNTHKQNIDVVKFLKLHIPDKLMGIAIQKCINKNTVLECVIANKITVPDAFGGLGEVILINNFATDIKKRLTY
uniref:Uncharacterized protein n=1 Tax=Podoviridae sp. ctaNW81 TaxID=2826562 RepID=A0A8S5M583_9CAUD|nr:MAG TPA: hypothetical protein [Podoviridae sp. ctaNW81]